MKEKDARVQGGHRMVVYVEKEDRSYGPLETGSYMVTNYYEDFTEKRHRLEEECRRRLTQGEISPVGYYMILTNITEADLASRVGVSRRKLRRHAEPGGFEKMDLSTARKYAETFNIPVANLFQLLEREGEGVDIAQEGTGHPLVTVTRASRTDT